MRRFYIKSQFQLYEEKKKIHAKERIFFQNKKSEKLRFKRKNQPFGPPRRGKHIIEKNRHNFVYASSKMCSTRSYFLLHPQNKHRRK